MIERRRGAWVWEGGPVPRGSNGITLGPLVILRRGTRSDYLLHHELVHVRQWRRDGVVGFASRYVAAYVVWRVRRKGHRGAYLRIPLEVEADWIARRELLAP